MKFPLTPQNVMYINSSDVMMHDLLKYVAPVGLEIYDCTDQSKAPAVSAACNCAAYECIE